MPPQIRIKDIEISGPLNIEKTFEYDTVTGVGKAMIKWTPTANDVGEDIPICFIAETTAEVPQNRPTTYNLLAHDPDGDNVRCRYGIKKNLECSTCKTVPGFTLDEFFTWLTSLSALIDYRVYDVVIPVSHSHKKVQID
ncbi:UNVERIFIED_CONTAM: hypothetical protein FKN15_075206 [Acipenser sinensis]